MLIMSGLDYFIFWKKDNLLKQWVNFIKKRKEDSFFNLSAKQFVNQLFFEFVIFEHHHLHHIVIIINQIY